MLVGVLFSVSPASRSKLALASFYEAVLLDTFLERKSKWNGLPNSEKCRLC